MQENLCIYSYRPALGLQETTPLEPGLITEARDRPRGRESQELGPKTESGVQPQDGHRKPNPGSRAKILGRAEVRGTEERRPSPAPLLTPRATATPSESPDPGSAPPTPWPRRPLLPAGRARRRAPPSTIPFPEPRQPSPHPRVGSGGPSAPALTRPAAVPVRSPGYSPSARVLGGGRARTPSSDPGGRPDSAPTASAAAPTRPLSGPNLGKALPGERGRDAFWHRNCLRAAGASASRARPGGGGAFRALRSHCRPGLVANLSAPPPLTP